MSELNPTDLQPKTGDSLVAVDLQNDFFAGGSLAVDGAEEIIPVFNQYIEIFQRKGLPIYKTRDWHPSRHCSFRDYGGPWPVHCVQGTEGADFHQDIRFPETAIVISKADTIEKEAYSDFEGTDFNSQLRSAGIERLYIGGLATDYCVLNTVRDALKNGFKVVLLMDAIRAVNVNPGDGERAIEEMTGLGAVPANLDLIS
jgi:nicotinamidase/pyrazinamidase